MYKSGRERKSAAELQLTHLKNLYFPRYHFHVSIQISLKPNVSAAKDSEICVRSRLLPICYSKIQSILIATSLGCNLLSFALKLMKFKSYVLFLFFVGLNTSFLIDFVSS